MIITTIKTCITAIKMLGIINIIFKNNKQDR